MYFTQLWSTILRVKGNLNDPDQAEVLIVDELLRHVKEEWGQLVKAPGAFFILFILAFLAAFAVVEWAHSAKMSGLEQQVSTVNSTNELLHQRIESKDEQLTDYRAKNLDLQAKLSAPAVSIAPIVKPNHGTNQTPPHKDQLRQSATRFSNATNAELVKFAETLASDIRQLAQTATAELQADPRSVIHQSMFNYSSNYQGDAIVLRDEIMSRLPLIKRDMWANSFYDHPTNPIGLNEVAGDLDRLARMLPQK